MIGWGNRLDPTPKFNTIFSSKTLETYSVNTKTYPPPISQDTKKNKFERKLKGVVNCLINTTQSSSIRTDNRAITRNSKN